MHWPCASRTRSGFFGLRRDRLTIQAHYDSIEGMLAIIHKLSDKLRF
jgi:hypothetical protein